MGWRLRKVFRSGPFRWTWSKRGVGWSCGIPGFRYGISPSGQRYISIGIPGTGVYFIKYFAKNKAPSSIDRPDTIDAEPPKEIEVATASTEPWWKQKDLQG